MASEEDILKKFDKLKDNKQFAVPDDYFESFADKVMSKIEAIDKPESKPIIRMVTIRKTLSWAASLTALFLLTYAAISILLPSVKTNNLSENEIIAALEKDLYYIDEIDLYSMVEETQQEASLENADLTEEEIINYLIEEGSDIDLLNTDF